ncbi:MAG: RNA-directed DNA polymerase [Planctomycetes bacterium]|nr:RNA-directed DNA polymerase [Planctomycetota bacterium]
MSLKRWFGRWLATAEHRLERQRAEKRRAGPPPWRYPDPFTGELITPPDDGDRDRLAAAGLPVLSTLEDLSRATGLSWQRLLWLAAPSSAYAGGSPHYTFFTVPKARGEPRIILAPKPALKSVQRWILRNILNRIPLADPVHGFRRGHGTRTNARVHCGKDVVATFDLEDFFHTVTYRRVRGLFRSLGYSTELSVLLGLLTTFRPAAFPYDYMRHVPTLVWLKSMSTARRSWRGHPTTPPFLPQGAPTSPALSNLVARHLDRRLAGLARRLGAAYTRYADDLTFSGHAEFRHGLARFLPLVKRIVREEGFYLATGKQRIRRKGGRQVVTGVVVNRRTNVPRETYRHLRVLLHKAAVHGPESVRLEPAAPTDPGVLRPHLEGWVAWVSHLNPARGARLRRTFEAIAWPAPSGEA